MCYRYILGLLALGLLLSTAPIAQAQSLHDEWYRALPLYSTGGWTFFQAGSQTDPAPWGDPASCQANDGDNYAWASFRPSQPSTVTIDLSGSDFDTVLVLYDAFGNKLGCDDDGGDGLTSRLENITVVSNALYLIRVSGYNGDEGLVNLTISSSGPDWDHPHNGYQEGETIGDTERAYFNWNGNTPAAAPQFEYAASCANDSEHSVWYRFVPVDTRTYEFYTSASGDELDTIITVWTASGGGTPLTEIACDNDGGEGTNAMVSIALNGGTPYLVRVSTWSGLAQPEGSFFFHADRVVGTATEEGGPVAALALASYPNPFTDATTVAYTLAQGGDVRVAVYDLLGREVAVLVDAAQAAGAHKAAFDATGLAAGVYVVRLQSGSTVQTTQLTLTR